MPMSGEFDLSARTRQAVRAGNFFTYGRVDGIADEYTDIVISPKGISRRIRAFADGVLRSVDGPPAKVYQEKDGKVVIYVFDKSLLGERHNLQLAEVARVLGAEVVNCTDR